MMIVHELKRTNNYSYFLNCPICGSNFQEMGQLKLLENYKNKMIEFDKNIKTYETQEDKKEYTMHCSNCTFQVTYILVKKERIKELN